MIPRADFENISDRMHISGTIATLYINKIKNATDNSQKLVNISFGLSAINIMIMKIVTELVSKSHKIDVIQKTCKFTPLTYCKNRALASHS